jgi:regulator of sigma E protease
MKTGPIAAVQPDSPAAEAGLLAGDVIAAINGHSIGSYDDAQGESWDAFALSTRLQNLAESNSQATLSIRRPDGDGFEDREIRVTPRVVDWLEATEAIDVPLSIPELGIAVEVTNEVAGLLPGSPAEKSEIRPGDQLVGAEIAVPKEDSDRLSTTKITFGKTNSLSQLIGLIQHFPAGMEVTLKYERDKKESTATLKTARDKAAQPAYAVERGLRLEPLRRIRIANSFSDQVRLGADETADSLLLVYRFLQKIGTQIPVTALGGPITIARAAGYSAFQGAGSLLIFLTLLSANLAVVNFLPIPLLDGGHMVFLAYEGIFRRPANEKLVLAFHTAGFVFIIALMMFLILLDVGLIDRKL